MERCLYTRYIDGRKIIPFLVSCGAHNPHNLAEVIHEHHCKKVGFKFEGVFPAKQATDPHGSMSGII
jgi:hypothetical protein